MTKKYEKYKSSGVEWIGDIPEHWEVRKLKYKCNFLNGLAFKPSEWKNNGTPIVRIQNLNGSEKYNYIHDNKKYNKSLLLKKDDLLFSWSGNVGTSFGVYIWEKDYSAFLNQHIFKIINYTDELKYLYWILKAVTTEIESQSHGIIGLVHVTKGELGGVSVPKIEKKEQQKIAFYLDKRSEEIDLFIKNKESLISLLEEEKKATITKAVTKGLNKNVKFKNSGVDWIGDIPQHWLLIKIKRLAKKITDGEHISPKFTLEGMPFLSAKDVRDKQINTNVNKFVSYNDGIKFRKRCNPSLGDILIVSRGATIGRIGLLETNDIFCLLGSVILIKPKNDIINYNYFFYLLNHEKVQEQLFFSSESSAQQAIYITNISNLLGFIPPLSEQQQIVAYLDKETQKIDDLKAKYRQEIDLIKEYKERLIYDVVTGKMNVLEH